MQRLYAAVGLFAPAPRLRALARCVRFHPSRPPPLNITGNIAGAAFEMQVNLDFSKESEGCVSLSGEYFYLSTFKPMAVEGKYCPAAKTLIIRRNDENGLPEETFTYFLLKVHCFFGRQ